MLTLVRDEPTVAWIDFVTTALHGRCWTSGISIAVLEYGTEARQNRLAVELFDELNKLLVTPRNREEILERRGYSVGTERPRRIRGKKVMFRKVGHREWRSVSSLERKAKVSATSAIASLGDALRQGFSVDPESGEMLSMSDRAMSLSAEEHRDIARKFMDRHGPLLDKHLKEMREMFPDANVYGGIKEMGSALRKLMRKPEKYARVDEMEDVGRFRVVRKTIAEVRDAVAKIKERYPLCSGDDDDGPCSVGSFEHDYLGGHPKEAAYRSYHLTVRVNGVPQEVQVRTEDQDVMGDWFHDALYKPQTEEQVKFADEYPDKIKSYARAVSEFWHRKGLGKKGKRLGRKPPCPDEIKQHFGCL